MGVTMQRPLWPPISCGDGLSRRQHELTPIPRRGSWVLSTPYLLVPHLGSGAPQPFQGLNPRIPQGKEPEPLQLGAGWSRFSQRLQEGAWQPSEAKEAPGSVSPHI